MRNPSAALIDAFRADGRVKAEEALKIAARKRAEAKAASQKTSGLASTVGSLLGAGAALATGNPALAGVGASLGGAAGGMVSKAVSDMGEAGKAESEYQRLQRIFDMY